MDNILTEDGLLNLDIEKDLYNLNLKQRLNTVKKHPSGKDTFVCPYDLKDQIGSFLNAYAIPYAYTEKPIGIEPNEIERQINRYLKLDVFRDKIAIFNTPFDNNALFKWSLQLFGTTEDHEYKKYNEHVREIMTAFYEQTYDENV